MRVVSLLPSATEIVAALGALEHLVGVTHACDHPPQVASRLRVTTTAVDGGAAPGAIDAQVRDLAGRGEPLYTLLEDRIRALHPDLLLTQALCDVCAVSETDVRALARRLEPEPRVVALSATTFDGVLDDIARAGEALGLADEAEELIAGSRARLRTVHDTLKAARAPRPRVAVIEWGDPLFAAGHWMPEMVRRAGGVDVLSERGKHGIVVTEAQVREAAPDAIIVAPCGYDLRRAAAEGERLLALDAWAWTRERGTAVFAIDANAFASRPGPRLVDGVEVLARCFNPSLFTPLEPEFARRLR